ncbi:hypothetical protein [Streptomyces phaeochromogenes]|uniref:hypothetical protein n=1 Tax=Streptomyces phaeochromogenes TaxID=1923 RepID=UPI00386751A4|nr:hypothetical protein OG277_38300 [Streptomyces phaeochromogenes]
MDIGPLATWASLPVSTLALFVSGATYLRTCSRDQHAEAVKVAVFHHRAASCCGHDLPSKKVEIHNGTDRPLHHVQLVTSDRTVSLYGVLPPGVRDHEHLILHVDTHHSAVIWQDHEGCWWSRHLNSQGVYRGGRTPLGRSRAAARAKRHALPPA